MQPTGAASISSPRRAFSRRASTERCRSKSNSDSFRLALQVEQEPVVLSLGA